MSDKITVEIDKDGDLWIGNVTEDGNDIVFTKDSMSCLEVSEKKIVGVGCNDNTIRI